MVFRSLYDELQARGLNPKGIRGNWKPSSDNTASLNEAILRGLSPEEAALTGTFTGHMSQKYGLNKVRIDYSRSVQRADGTFEEAVVYFDR